MGRMSICQLILKPFWCFALLLRVHNISCHISVCAVCCRFSFSIFTFPIFWFSLARFRCSRFRHARTQLVKWKMSWQLFIIPICCELFFLNIRTYNSFYRLWYRHRHHYKHISSAHMRTHTHSSCIVSLRTQIYASVFFHSFRLSTWRNDTPNVCMRERRFSVHIARVPSKILPLFQWLWRWRSGLHL